MFQATVLSLFPNEFRQFFLKGIFAKAYANQLFDLSLIDLRQFGVGPHKKVDDYPVSKRQGMLLRADVILKALSTLEDFDQYRIIYTCPKGKLFNQALANDLKNEKKGIVIIPGYYRGIDQRIFDCVNIERVSVGNYVLNSGDIPALSILDSVIRLIPGVLGNSDCIDSDSLESDWLEAAQFTKPDTVNGISVPALLKSGNHAEIVNAQLTESILTTLFKRPDLIAGKQFTQNELLKITESIKSIL